MNILDRRYLLGVLLILAGAIFMGQNLGFFPSAWEIVWGLFFGLAGAAFFYAFYSDRSQWWTLIPGMCLLGLMLLVLGDAFVPRFVNLWGGSIFLGAIAVSFWLVYLVNRQAWWAVIPAGVLTTLAFVAGLDNYLVDSGEIFLFGLGFTFLLVGILPTPSGRMTWAFIPGGILIVIGLLTSSLLVSYLNFIWPVALIVLGGYFIVRNFI